VGIVSYLNSWVKEMNIDPGTGRFKATPEGVKTPRMLEVERALGRTLEEDFEEYHIKKGWGQKRLANRWGVKRELIFSTGMRGGRRSWVMMLNLKVRRRCDSVASTSAAKMACELCLAPEVSLDRAHWVSNQQGGSAASSNILNLCPNCHRKLDRDDLATVSKCREILLFRECRRIIESGGEVEAKRRRLVEISTAILSGRPL
jgi:hypothetical protein